MLDISFLTIQSFVIDAKISKQFLFPDEDIITNRSQLEKNDGTTTTATTTGVARIEKRKYSDRIFVLFA